MTSGCSADSNGDRCFRTSSLDHRSVVGNRHSGRLRWHHFQPWHFDLYRLCHNVFDTFRHQFSIRRGRQHHTQSIIVTNTGAENLTVPQAAVIGAQFSVSGISLPLTLSAGHQTTFTVSFSPTSARSASGSLSITSRASSTPTNIALSEIGVAATHLLGASPTSLSFGNVNDGSTGTLSVTLTNNGNAIVTIASVAPAGAGFSTNGLSAGTALTPNQSATLNVVFAPTGTGSVSGSVSIMSNATNSPASISLSGAGVQSTSYSVVLSWTASTSSGVVDYNVYRATSPGSYSRIASLVSGTTYTDSTVQSGQDITYYYVVTSFFVILRTSVQAASCTLLTNGMV